jgi:hypothetical protein
MDNFYTISQGDRLPRGGTNLDPTTGVYNIGDSTYYWDEVYCNTLDAPRPSNIDYLITRHILTTAAQSVEFTGLTDQYNYELRLKYSNMNGPSTSIYLLINGITAGGFGGIRAIVDGKTDTAYYISISSIGITNLQLNYPYVTTTMNTASAIGVWSISPKRLDSSLSLPSALIQGALAGACYAGATEWLYHVDLFLLSGSLNTLTSIKIWANTSTGIPINSVVELWKK